MTPERIGHAISPISPGSSLFGAIANKDLAFSISKSNSIDSRPDAESITSQVIDFDFGVATQEVDQRRRPFVRQPDNAGPRSPRTVTTAADLMTGIG
jgi:hypothetical protein